MPRARDEFGRVTPIQKYGKEWVDWFDNEWEDACFPFLLEWKGMVHWEWEHACRRILGAERYKESRRVEETA